MLRLTKSVQDLKVIRQIKLISNAKRVSRGTQTLHWTWSVNIQDQGVQCNMKKPTSDARNQTETIVESNDSTPSDTTEESDSTSYSETSDESDYTLYSESAEETDTTCYSGATEVISDTAEESNSISDMEEYENKMDTQDNEIERWFNRIEFKIYLEVSKM